MRRIPLDMSRTGDILAQSVYDSKGRVLLKAGNHLNPYLVSRIKEHGTISVYIADDADDLNSLKDIISPLIRLEAVESVRQIYDQFMVKATAEDILQGRKVLFNENPHISNLKKVAENLTDDVFLNSSALVEMVNIKNLDTYIYDHSVNVAVLSLLLGMDLHLKESDLNNLVLSALLMDIGNHFIDPTILNSPKALTNDQWAIVKTHPEKSYTYLSQKTLVSAQIRHTIMQHHERWDGSGYPNALRKEDISLLARILGITDTYDALTSDRPYRPAFPTNEALEMIMGSAGRLFDFKLVNLFAHRVIAYPVGTYVLLSNGEQGEIIDINLSIPLRPIVRIAVSTENSRKNTVVDLSVDLNITIKNVIYQFND